MNVIKYPRNRSRQFKILFLWVGMFVAGFFWTVKLGFFLQDHFGITKDVGIYFFVANVGAIGFSGMWVATRWKDQIQKDYNRVWKMAKITKRDEAWLEANCPPENYTIHSLEGRWPQGEPKRLPNDLHVEFHDDEDRVLFEIARDRSPEAKLPPRVPPRIVK